jgi:hypothetical protein
LCTKKNDLLRVPGTRVTTIGSCVQLLPALNSWPTISPSDSPIAVGVGTTVSQSVAAVLTQDAFQLRLPPTPLPPAGIDQVMPATLSVAFATSVAFTPNTLLIAAVDRVLGTASHAVDTPTETVALPGGG